MVVPRRPRSRRIPHFCRLRRKVFLTIRALYRTLVLSQRIQLPLDQGIQLLLALITRFESDERPLLITRAQRLIVLVIQITKPTIKLDLAQCIAGRPLALGNLT